MRSGYWMDDRGAVRRDTPKRDKTVSARQWRKQVKAKRRAAREATDGRP